MGRRLDDFGAGDQRFLRIINLRSVHIRQGLCAGY